jgi:hypothetical protein
MDEEGLQYECYFCKRVVSSIKATSHLDPCALIVVSNIDMQRDDEKEQKFYRHFECFRKLVNNDGILYIMEPDQATIGEIAEDEKNWSADDDLIT